LPILQGVRIEAAENTVRLAATDLESTVFYACADAMVLEPGLAVIADARRLKELVVQATKDEAEIAAVDEQTVRLSLHGELGEREHLLPAGDLVDWPVDPAGAATQQTDALFLAQYQALVPFGSTDASRAIINGVCIDVTDKAHTLVATDGRRLSALNSIHLPINQTCVIPTNKFLTWSQLKGACRIGVSKDNSLFGLTCGPWSLTCKTIEGTYPNWRQVIPKDGACGIDIDEADLPILEEAVRTFPVSDKSTRPISITPHGTRARLSALDPESGQWSNRDLPASRCYGEGTCINRDFLREAVKAGFHQFRWQDGNSPLVARTEAGGTHVLMPLRSDAPPKSKSTPPKPKPGNPQKENKPVIKPKEETQSAADASSVEQLWLSYQAVRDRVRDLNTALSELGDQLRDAKKQDKTVRSELKNARGVLAKLQNIQI
jgi:DNA polymerase-3 subunit beta